MNLARHGRSDAPRIVAATCVAALLLTALYYAVAPTPTLRNFEFMPDMARSPAVESQSGAHALPGGLSDQPLVPGVMVRGEPAFPYGATPEEAERAGRELSDPLLPSDGAAPQAADLERGATIFRVHCAVCHGADGAGRGLAVQRGMLPPPALGSATALALSDGAAFHLITRGRGNMPALGARILPDDRWRAILYVRQLQKGGGR